MDIIRFVKDWTLPCAIAVGTTAYLTFYYVPQLDTLGDRLAPVFDVIFPLFVFLTLLVTFCKVDFHQMRPHRWHVGILVAQLLLIAAGFLGSQQYVTDAFGVELNPRTNVKTEEGHYKTSVEKVFVAGDMHRGQSLVVWGVAEGRGCAREVDEFLMGYSFL